MVSLFGIGRKTAIAILIVVLAFVLNKYKSRKNLSPILEIDDGKLQGIESFTRSDRKIYEYRRIPFAKKPIGNLRFEPPQPVESWTDILDATSAGPQCLQVNTITGLTEGSEDCLYLNVYTPVSRGGVLPVMIYIHGGAFLSGSANLYNPAYLLDQDVILVTTNYRLSALGFLSTGDEVVRGNQGLKDQTLALKWVQKNIKYFGGDPNQVTLFGESAGSMSVGYHLLSPFSKGLFSRAILQSGSPLGSSLNREPRKQAKRFAAKFECPDTDTKEMVNCLKNLDVNQIAQAYYEALPLLKESITLYLPTIETVQDENTFLGEEPMKILLSGKINKVPLIAGVTEHEGLLVSSVIIANKTILQLANDEWFSFAPLTLYYSPENRKASEAIRQFYFPNVKNIGSTNYLSSYTNMFGDRKFNVPIHNFVKEYRKHAPVRLYMYTYSGEFSLGDILAASQSERLPAIVGVIFDMSKRWLYRKILGIEIPHLGVCHADELQLLFNWQLSSYISKDHKDYKVSNEMVKLWTDFASSRNVLKTGNIEWPTINNSSLQYLKINDNPEIIEEPFTDRILFWNSLKL